MSENTHINPQNQKKQLMSFKEWVFELFQDEKNEVSIKPVIAFIGAMFLCITMAINAFVQINVELLDSLVNAVMVITSIGMGADSVDKFSSKGKRTTTRTTTTRQTRSRTYEDDMSDDGWNNANRDRIDENGDI